VPYLSASVARFPHAVLSILYMYLTRSTRPTIRYRTTVPLRTSQIDQTVVSVGPILCASAGMVSFCRLVEPNPTSYFPPAPVKPVLFTSSSAHQSRHARPSSCSSRRNNRVQIRRPTRPDRPLCAVRTVRCARPVRTTHSQTACVW